jgi:S1-C subfamily serine protease
MIKTIQIIFLIIILAGAARPAFAEKFADNVVTITVASQGYDSNSPWQKLSVQKEIISGIVIKGNRILTVSHKLADHVLVEISKFGEYRKYPAKIILKDYQCGLALLTVPDKSFFTNLKPVEFNTDSSVKDKKTAIVRWDANGILKTHPAEYQKSLIEFLDSSGAVLIHQMTSDIDFGGLGEPVFINEKLAGITLWHSAKTKTIKAIDVNVIERMLKDFQSGTYQGMPFFNIEDAPLENDENLREFLGLQSKNTGILVINVPPKTSGYDILKKGDVILNINGIDLDDNGFYISKKYGKLAYYGIIYLNHFINDTIKMKLIRNKKKIDISFKLKPFSDDSFLIPPSSYDTPPKYYIIGGLIFQELTKEYLKIWGEEWPSTSDKRLMYYYDNLSKYPSKDKKRIVILTAVLPAAVNIGYHNIRNLILRSINGQGIKDLADLKNIIDKSNNKFFEFDFIGEQRIILESSDAKKSINEIIQKYRIQSPYYMGDAK